MSSVPLVTTDTAPKKPKMIVTIRGIAYSLVILEMAVRSYLIMLTIPQFLIISPFVFYGFLGGLALWTVLYSRKGRKRMEAAMLLSSKAPEVSTAEVIVV